MFLCRKRAAPDDSNATVVEDEELASGTSASSGGAGVSDGQPASKRKKSDDLKEQKDLMDVQLELARLEEKCAEEQIKIQMDYDRKRQPHFDRRGKLMRKIPDFWKAALSGHPNKLVHDAEVEVLGHLKDLRLRDNIDRCGSFEVSAVFSSNEFFEEKMIKKTVTFRDSEAVVEAATLTPKCDTCPQTLKDIVAGASASTSRTHIPAESAPQHSVLGWFADKTYKADDFGDLLRRDLWQDPVLYRLAFLSGPKAQQT